MKKVNSVRLSVIFAGCFLGAGYVSGQELWQFFGSFGLSGVYGLVLANLLKFTMGVMIILFARRTGIEGMDEIVCRDIKWLKHFSGFLQVFFMFGIYIIMCAGAGALLKQLFNAPMFIGSGILCLLVMLVAFKGMNGVINVFSCFVPSLVVVAILISVMSAVKFGLPNFKGVPVVNKNPLIGNWFFSAVTYVSYNLLGSIGILILFGKRVKSENSTKLGIGIGALLLLMISGSIITAEHTMLIATKQELPMLYIACNLNIVLGYIYAVLLWGGMYGAALSTFVATLAYGGQKSEKIKEHRNALIVALSIVAWGLSLAGFGKLIGVVYPIFGYFGFVALAGIAINFIRTQSCKESKKG